MSTKTLAGKLARLEHILKPPPRIIDCTGAREELLAMLGYVPGEDETPVEWADEQLRTMQALDDIIERDVERIERECNIRLVCYDDN